jgi:predicted DNA-binding transcriptional regulator AlpA
MSTHLDKRAGRLAEEGAAGSPDELLNTVATAQWLGISRQRLESWRSEGGGPPFIRISHRCVRYRRSQVLAWLKEREVAHTSQLAKRLQAKAKPARERVRP